MSSLRHRGDRARRRSARRRRRTWVIVTSAVVLVVGVAAVATLLARNGDADVSARFAPRSRVSGSSLRSGTTSATTVPGLPCRSGLTPSAPLRLWIAGDSIAYSVGNGLGKQAAATGVVAPVYESRVSSGLSTPGFFDWPGRVTQELPRLDPEVVVFVMGTNDWSVPRATPVDASGQPAWKTGYRAKVQNMVDALTTDGRTLYWVGPPVLRDPKQEEGVRDVAAVIRSVVNADPDAQFFDLHDLLDGDDGSYTATVNIDGSRVQVRTGDGVHLTPDGADYVGDALFARIDAQCRMKTQAVPGSPQRVVETKGSTSVSPEASATPATVPTEDSSPTTVPTSTPVAPTTVPSTQVPTATTLPGTPITTPAGPPGKSGTP